MDTFSAFVDELLKIAAPPLPAAALSAMKSAPGAIASAVKPKLYGQEGFNALMHGAQGAKSNPFSSMKLSGVFSKLIEGVGEATRGGGFVSGTTKAAPEFESWAKQRAAKVPSMRPSAPPAAPSGKWPMAPRRPPQG